ncbi:hypothetical protein SEA_COEUR_18 [Gordonia phage Coeur]|uniref:Uncharacterized protein n=1 Tax=Gordonia phage Coeur TaxID=2571246 RepID=A0A4Y6EFD4_9CAUD|nr:hypothetical protein PQC60_gp18 [Gordonia phage Coeur]QDF17436.1 hypothetical protein SEA_COEUR_18 [Gordonia phage Coeur]
MRWPAECGRRNAGGFADDKQDALLQNRNPEGVNNMVIENIVYTITGGAVTPEMTRQWVIEQGWWLDSVISFLQHLGQ